MKKYIYFVLSIILIVLIFNVFTVMKGKSYLNLKELNYFEIKDKLIRFHVIANSDNKEDQELKLKVRDKVVEALSKKLYNVNSLEEAEIILNDNIEYVNKIAKQVIEENNYAYGVNTVLSYENFPDKIYGDCIVPQGNYEAFRVIIGEGKGQNWWCVMFPSLCFIDESKSLVDSISLEEDITNIQSKDKEIKNKESSSFSNEIKFKFKISEVVKDILD